MPRTNIAALLNYKSMTNMTTPEVHLVVPRTMNIQVFTYTIQAVKKIKPSITSQAIGTVT